MTRLSRMLPAVLLLAGTLALADTLPPAPPAPADSAIDAKFQALGQRLDQDSAKGKVGMVDGRTLGMLVVQVLLSLSVVTGLGFGALFAWSRLRRRTAKGQSAVVDVLETRSLSPGRTLHLVRVHNRVVAIATTAQGAASVTEFRDNEAAEIIAELGAGSVTTRDFSAALDTLLERFRRPGSQGGDA
jgi:flagellar biogenesis protein FliO